jgi:hypothetical protein
MKPSSRAVLELLSQRPTSGVTQQDAIRELACYRLAARISDLRAEGYVITAESVGQGGVRFARYRLVIPETSQQLEAFG